MRHEPLANVGVRLILASAQEAGPDERAQTNDQASSSPILQEQLTAVVDQRQGALTRVRSRRSAASRGQAIWAVQGKPVIFDLVPKLGQVVYAETIMHGNLRLLPLTHTTRTRATLFIMPRVLFSFA